jgi:hypothetical protein
LVGANLVQDIVHGATAKLHSVISQLEAQLCLQAAQLQPAKEEEDKSPLEDNLHLLARSSALQDQVDTLQIELSAMVASQAHP